MSVWAIHHREVIMDRTLLLKLYQKASEVKDWQGRWGAIAYVLAQCREKHPQEVSETIRLLWKNRSPEPEVVEAEFWSVLKRSIETGVIDDQSMAFYSRLYTLMYALERRTGEVFQL
jgi:hypothetical protein